LAELKSLFLEFKATNEKMTSIAESLKLLSDDVIKRESLKPLVEVSFGGGNQEINCNSGSECEIEFMLFNKTKVSAKEPSWTIFLPKKVQILEAGNFIATSQESHNRYADYTSLAYSQSKISASDGFSSKIKIKTEKAFIGKKELPFKCCCDGIPAHEGKLSINFVGN
jgi:hypothetical protein